MQGLIKEGLFILFIFLSLVSKGQTKDELKKQKLEIENEIKKRKPKQRNVFREKLLIVFFVGNFSFSFWKIFCLFLKGQQMKE